jgi:hypothetical protein
MFFALVGNSGILTEGKTAMDPGKEREKQPIGRGRKEGGMAMAMAKGEGGRRKEGGRQFGGPGGDDEMMRRGGETHISKWRR